MTIVATQSSGYKFDQSSLQLEVVVKLGDQYLSRGVRFPARTTPDQSFKKVREMINNLITRLKEDIFSEDEHKVCVVLNGQRTLVHNSRLRWGNLGMEVAKLFAQVSHQVDNDLLVKVKKLIQDLIWKLQPRFLRKASVIPS